jgi:pyruvate-formate lyase-activating enzyme
MKIQSLSVLVPTKGCVNRCPFCVSEMHKEKYSDEVLWGEIEKRLRFVSAKNSCDTLILTGAPGEAQQNKEFLKMFGMINKQLLFPYYWIELQSTGVMFPNDMRLLWEEFKFLTNDVGVTTISLSISDIFDLENNKKILGYKKPSLNTLELCKAIKKWGFNLRISINMLSLYNSYSPKQIIDRAKELEADQITFRKLYAYGGSEQAGYVRGNSCLKSKINEINDYIIHNGEKLQILPFGAIKYSVDGVSVVVDSDCMNKETKEALKFVILRGNKLYSRWDNKSSLLF